MSGIRGRPLKYDKDTKLALLATYSEIPRGERVEFARHLGVSLNTLMVYMSQWRKELYYVASPRITLEELQANDAG
jgi:hypothetical protein